MQSLTHLIRPPLTSHTTRPSDAPIVAPSHTPCTSRADLHLNPNIQYSSKISKLPCVRRELPRPTTTSREVQLLPCFDESWVHDSGALLEEVRLELNRTVVPRSHTLRYSPGCWDDEILRSRSGKSSDLSGATAVEGRRVQERRAVHEHFTSHSQLP